VSAAAIESATEHTQISNAEEILTRIAPPPAARTRDAQWIFADGYALSCDEGVTIA
jgi:hypothetical protein